MPLFSRSRRTQPRGPEKNAPVAASRGPPPLQLDAGSGTSQVPAEAMRCCIKIFSNAVAADYLRPWQKCDGEACTGSGFAIEGQHILTNSHVVRDQQLLQVQRPDRPGKWFARLLIEGIQCDLALLAVDDASFWDDLPLQPCTDDIPGLQSIVTAVGYPVGGDNLCVTRGVVSRIDLVDYTFLEQVSGERLLVLQIDAAINAGNSGGPVFGASGGVVGVAFAGLDEADNIGYVIPMPVIKLFLSAFEERGAFGQLPSLGVTFQPTENKGDDAGGDAGRGFLTRPSPWPNAAALLSAPFPGLKQEAQALLLPLLLPLPLLPLPRTASSSRSLLLPPSQLPLPPSHSPSAPHVSSTCILHMHPPQAFAGCSN